MLLGGVELNANRNVAQAFRRSPAVVTVHRFCTAFGNRGRWQGCISSFPQAERAVPAQAAYLTLWTMQQVVQRGTGRQLGAKYRTCIWQGKQGLPTIT
ncbi:hypothetical protein ACLK17_01005 [Escherichia coli]